MSANPQHPPYTVAAYLRIDQDSPGKVEFAAGEIVAMSGASSTHNLITGNLVTLLNVTLRDTPCLVYPGELRVSIPAAQAYRYPDVSVVCDEPQINTDEAPGSLLNPVLLVEVLSPSTQITDRNAKLREYRQIPSLAAYLLVSQDIPHIEVYQRQTDTPGQWLYSDAAGLEGSISLLDPACVLPLREVYRKVGFEGV